MRRIPQSPRAQLAILMVTSEGRVLLEWVEMRAVIQFPTALSIAPDTKNAPIQIVTVLGGEETVP